MAGRPREFDEDQVLADALDVFWSRGYASTSLSELVEKTGLAKGSLYKAFGDKRNLFTTALERYLARGVEGLEELAADESPKRALRRWLELVVSGATCEGIRRGCLAVNCTVELAPHDTEMRKRLRKQERALERVYARLIGAGIEAGEFRRDLDPEAGARWLTTMVDGLQVRGKLGLTRKAAMETVELALRTLE